MNDIEPLSIRFDKLHSLEKWGLPILLLIVVLTRLPFFTAEPYSWDAFNFTLGVERFSPSDDMPHFPGYFFHIGLGKLFSLALGDAQAGLHATSLLYSLITVFGLFAFTRVYLAPILNITNLRSSATFSLSTAALAAFNPMFWHFNETELAYDGGAMIGILAGALVILAPRLSRGWIFAAGSIALLGGIRPDCAIYGLFWICWALWNRLSLKQWLLSAVAVMVCTAAWLVPTAIASGDLHQYFGVGGHTFDSVRDMYVMNAGGWWPWIGHQFINSFGWVFFTIGPALLVILALGKRSWRAWKMLPRQFRWILLLWGIPPLVFSAIFFHGGHFLLALAPCTLGVSSLLWLSLSRPKAYLITMSSVLIVGAAWFLLPILPNGQTLPYTRGRIEANDLAMKTWREALTKFEPGQRDAILFYSEMWPWRAAVRDFPEASCYQINPMPKNKMLIVGARLFEEYIPSENENDLFTLPSDTKRLFVPSTKVAPDRVLVDFTMFLLTNVIEVPEVEGRISVYQRR
jgi:hypothetical protein